MSAGKKSQVRMVNGAGRSLAGFTLIEVLVVVAIIALLVSILIPSLARARDTAKMVMCQGHLKEMGKAMGMYLIEYKDRLPGPLHYGMLKYTKNINPAQKTFYLPALLRKYFTEHRDGTGSTSDAIASCPNFPSPDSAFLSTWGTGPNPFHYCVNTSDLTKPEKYYFGFTHAGIKDYKEWLDGLGNVTKNGYKYYPKRVTAIKQVAKEWAIADAFIRPWKEDLGGTGVSGTALPMGTWPREDEDDDSNSGGTPGKPRLPTSPFHLGTGYAQQGGGWVYRGKTSTLYFDMHVESQRGWSRYTFNRDY